MSSCMLSPEKRGCKLCLQPVLCTLAGLDNLREVSHERPPVSPAEPHEASVYLPLPFPVILKDIPLSGPSDFPHLGFMEVKRRIIIGIMRSSGLWKLVDHDGLHFDDVEGFSMARDQIKLPCFPCHIAIAERKTVPFQVLGSNTFPQISYLFPRLRRNVHGFYKNGLFTIYILGP